MIPKEVLKKIRRMQITTSRAVTDVFAGQYKSVFKGKGMEFDEVREYLPGDDIRSIDWNVTARLGHPYIKKFSEERELTVMLMVDVSKSMYCGSAKQLKRSLAAELCSVLAFSAIKNNDRVGLILFSDKIEKFVAPRKGLKHVLRIIRELIYGEPESTGTDIASSLEYLNKICKRKSVVFLVSDFFDPEIKKSLAITNRKHDLVAISINDKIEKDLPDLGILNLHDAETGKYIEIDSSNYKVRKEYSIFRRKQEETRKKMFRSINVDHIEISNHETYIKDLVKFFKKRESRAR